MKALSPMRPTANDWDRFWDRRQAEACAQVSWSKRRVIDVIRPFLQKDLTVLDAGCGSGFFARYFLDSGLRTVACDYSDEALRITRTATGGRADVVKLDLVSPQAARALTTRFDVIFSDGLLEHFSAEDQGRILANFQQVLSPSGTLITVVPNRWSPWQLIRPFVMPGIHEKPFTSAGLVRLHETNGFRILSSGGVNVLPFRFSPDKIAGKHCGMLLYTIAVRRSPVTGHPDAFQ